MELAPFLAASAAVDCDHPAVRRLADEVRRADALATVRAAYETVRDGYAHSYDIAATEVSVSASDVLRHGHGICFAKAHLLAAVLRACGVPTAMCYQKLARDDGAPQKTCLHGLNAVWLDGSWHRLDPRGNKPGTTAPFDPACERLAYAIDRRMASAITTKSMPSRRLACWPRSAKAPRSPNSTATCLPISARRACPCARGNP